MLSMLADKAENTIVLMASVFEMTLILDAIIRFV